MYFDYWQYVRGCLVIPLLVALFALLMIISVMSHYVPMFFRKTLGYQDVVNILLVFLICGFFLCMNIGRLSHGGIHLIYERESSAIELHGEIDEIEYLGRYSFPEMKSEYGYENSNGVQFTIDGVQCTAVVKGGLEIGDYVTISYLPMSGYILSIVETENV